MSDGIRVIHVDDEADFADMTETFLECEDERLVVDTATSASQALDRLDDTDYDCIVSDHDMPGMDGIEFLETVRRDYRDIPFILFTGRGSEEVASNAISAGVSDYLQKEGGSDQYTILANRIRNHTERVQAKRERHRHLQAIETAQEGISILDEDGHFLYVNDAFADLYGYEPDDMIDEHIELIKRDEDLQEIFDEILPTVKERGYWRGETVGSRADGSTFPEEHAFSITDAGELICTVREMTDQTEQERTSHESEERYRLLVQGSPNPVYVEQGGEIVYANDALVDLLNADTRSDILGMSPLNYIHPEFEDLAQERLETLRDGESIERRGGKIVTLDGADKYVEVTATSVRWGGEPANQVHYIDITERKEQERELRQYKLQFEAVLNNPETIVGILTPDGIVERMNETALEMIGEEATAVEGMPFWETPWWTHSAEVQAKLRSRIDRAANGEYVRFDATHPRPDGSEFHMDATIYPVIDENGDVTCLVGVGRDVTPLKEHEQELERKNEQLDEFAGVLSHDLRNPLNVASGNLALVAEECDSEYLKPIGSALDRMESLIENMLESVRAGEPVTEIEPVELKTVTETCWRNVATDEATFDVQSESTIRADRTRVAQLLENLFRNAIEHGGDAVTITIGDLDDGTGFYVADDGTGIPEDERSEVFDTGYSTSQEGTGLGLSIVKQVVEAHGWKIDLTESDDGGARFEIRDVEVLE